MNLNKHHQGALWVGVINQCEGINCINGAIYE